MDYKYNWDEIVDRTGTYAKATEIIPIEGAKVKDGFTKIPMWIADMNFKTAPTVTEEMIKRTEHAIFGYFTTPDEYYDSIIDWQKKRNGVKNLKRENIEYENGVLGGVVSVADALLSRGDNILVHSSAYIGFTASLKNAGYNLVYSPLYKDEDGVWRMDYDDMDKKIRENKIHLAVFCSPHNPTGRVWNREEIEKAMEVFEKNDVYVISDEIWSDIILFDNKHIPTQSVNEYAKMHTVAFYAPSKTFNLAGLQGSYHIIYSNYLNDRILKESGLSYYNVANVISVAALIGAYKEEGHIWTDELLSVLSGNIEYAYNYILDNFKGVKVSKPEGTYLLYIDIEDWMDAHEKTIDDVLKKGVEVGIIWQDGRPFLNNNTIRMNFALPHKLVVEAMERLDKYVFNGNW